VFDWLFEGRLSGYVILGALTALFLLVWWRTRKRWCLYGGALPLILVGVYALLDRVVETDREQLIRKVQQMAAAVNAGDVNELFANVSENFRSSKSKDKQQFRSDVENYIRMVHNVRVWDIVCLDAPSREHPPARVVFSAKAESGRDLLADCEATFEFDAKHGWRLQRIRLLKPQTNEEWPIQL
jgi:hypothetical protein